MKDCNKLHIQKSYHRTKLNRKLFMCSLENYNNIKIIYVLINTENNTDNIQRVPDLSYPTFYKKSLSVYPYGILLTIFFGAACIKLITVKISLHNPIPIPKLEIELPNTPSVDS